MREYLQRSARGERLPGSVLAVREEEVGLIAEGRSSQEIADLLVISVTTVERHGAERNGERRCRVEPGGPRPTTPPRAKRAMSPYHSPQATYPQVGEEVRGR